MAHLPNEMNDSFEIPLDEQGKVQELPTELVHQTLSFNTDFDCADSELTTEFFSEQDQEISFNSPLNTNKEIAYTLPPFQSTFSNNIPLNVISLASYESYQVPDIIEDFKLVNHTVNIDNAAQNETGSRHNYSELIDKFDNIEPANLLEFSEVSPQKESPVNVSSTDQLEGEIEARKKTSLSTSVIANKNPPSDALELDVNSIPRTNNEPEVAISSVTQHHKHADVPHKPYVKENFKENSIFRTFKDMPGKFSREYLDFQFASCSELNEHICQECGKDCKFKSRLKIHSVVHTGEKPFVCDICQKCVLTKRSVKRHKKTHHPETF